MADWFLTGDDMGFLVDAVTQWVAYGVGLGAVLWLLGAAVHVIKDVVSF